MHRHICFFTAGIKGLMGLSWQLKNLGWFRVFRMLERVLSDPDRPPADRTPRRAEFLPPPPHYSKNATLNRTQHNRHKSTM